LWNLPRLHKKVQFVIDTPFEPQPIFSFLQQVGNVDDKEMYQTFNMGMGFVVIVENNDVKETISLLSSYSQAKIKKVGYITKGSGVTVPPLSLTY